MSIKVNGQGKISLKPDLIKMDVHIKTSSHQYHESMDENNRKSSQLKKAFLSADFDDIKTESFYMNQEVKDNDEVLFHVNHSLSFEFDLELDVLNKVIEVFSKEDVLFNLSFGLKNKKKAQADLFENARLDALEKAKMLVSLENKTLGDIKRIDAGQFHPHFISSTQLTRMSTLNQIESLTPQNITLETNVLYEWEIL